MASKTVPFNKKGIANLPNDKPVMYKVLTKGGKNNYTGVAPARSRPKNVSKNICAEEKIRFPAPRFR